MSTKRELLSTIEQQQQKITKYEKRIQDLAQAYRGLQKEKEALQASLSALSDSNEVIFNSGSAEQTSTTNSTEQGESTTNEHVEESDSESTFSGFENDSQEIVSLRNRVVTLKASLKTISIEKSRSELSLKEDRKKLLEEQRKSEEKLQNEVALREKLQKEHDEKLQELKTKVLVSHHEREQESTNSVMMLRELEGKLSKERSDKEKFEFLLDEAKEKNRQLTHVITVRTQEKHQKQITDLQNELEQVRSRLKKAEEQCQEPPILKKLQNQMLEMKIQYTDAIEQEQMRAKSAEESARQLSEVHEERVAALEARLTELSLAAATQDRTKQSHIKTIHSLKEKLSSVIEENRELASKASSMDHSKSISDKFNKEASTYNYNSLVDNFVELWEQITTMSTKSGKSIDIEALLLGSDVIHKSCQAEYNHLKQEMERLSRNKDNRSSPKREECSCDLNGQVEELKERLRTLTTSSQMSQVSHTNQVASLRAEVIELKDQLEKEKSQLMHEHKVAIGALEHQLSEQCQRSLHTLQDRDEEIHRLTQKIHQLNKEAKDQPTTVAAALLSQVSTGGADGPLLHHLEESARKDLEITNLRKNKRELERSLRDIQFASTEKQQNMQDNIDCLEEEIARLNRNTSRKGENLEYLKNVVLRYMTSTDHDSRHLMLNAIAAVLKFTQTEVESVRSFLALWWWQTPPKGKSSAFRKVSDASFRALPSRSPSISDIPKHPSVKPRLMPDSS